MSDQPQQKSAWVLKAQRVIGTLLYHNEEWFNKAIFGTGLKITDLPNYEYFRPALQAMLDILKTKEVIISPENVWTYSGKQVPLEWCEQVQVFHDIDILDLVSDARACIKLGQRAYRLERAQAAVTALYDETKSDDEVVKVLVKEMSVSRAVEVRSAKFNDIMARIREDITRGIVTHCTPTGLTWFDLELKGGLRSRRYLALGAREKGRKSTLLRNILLGTSRQFTGWERQRNGRVTPKYMPREDVSIALLAYENDQQIGAWDFVAMLAYEYLYYRGQDRDGLGDIVNGEDLQTGYESGEWKEWVGDLREAVTWAVAEAEKLNLYIYDSQTENGGLRTLDDMNRIINMHKGVIADEKQHVIFAIDYAQLVRGSGNMFDDLREFSSTALATATGMNSTVIALTQFNRETNKMNAKKEDTGDVMGTRGGADIEQDVHNYFEVIYDVDNLGEETIRVKNRRSRRGKSSRNRQFDFNIHPVSGLILLKPPIR